MKFIGKQKLVQQGPFSSLYRVEKEGKLLAMKLFTEAAAPELLQEARLFKALDSNFWPGLLEDHSSEKPAYFLMEWVSGKPLEHVDHGQNFQFILSIFQQLILALRELHQQSWIHGDLKGNNVLWTGEHVKILDLGFAKSKHDWGSIQISGTPAYMAPELFFGRPPRPSSDFYALAMMFYKWLLGKFPFQAMNFQEVLHWHLLESPSNLHASLDWLPVEFGDLLLRLLAKNPGDRPQSAEEILGILSRQFALKSDFAEAGAELCEETYEIFGEAIRFYEQQDSLGEEENRTLAELYYRQGHLEKVIQQIEDQEGAEDYLLRVKVKTRQGLFEEAKRSIQVFEQRFLGSLSLSLRLAYLNARGVLDFYLGNLEASLKAFHEAQAQALSGEDFSHLAVAFNNLGNLLLESGEDEKALISYGQALAFTRLSGDRIHEGMFLMSLGYYHHLRQHWMDAAQYYQQSIQILGNVGQQSEKGRSLLNYSNLLIECGDLDQAFQVLREAQGIFKRRKLSYLASYSLLLEGDILFKRDQALAACEIFKNAETELRAMQREGDALWAAFRQAECFRSMGNLSQASQFLEQLKMSPLLPKIGRLQEQVNELEKELNMNSVKLQNLSPFQKEIEIFEKDLVGELDLSILVEKILDKMIQVTHAERGFVILREKTGPHIALARNMGQESLSDSPEQISASIAGNVMDKGEALLTVDALEDERFSVVSSIHHLKLRSILCLPFMRGSEVLGAIYLDHRGQSGVFQAPLLHALKPFTEMLGKILSNARRFFEVESDLKATRKKLEAAQMQLQLKYDYANIVGRHPKMREVFSMLDRVTDVEVPTILLGESGVGKELMAQAIHYNGPRSQRSFVSMNCQAIPESLFESELFGHTKGAFTGAISDRMGLVEQAQRGTLFLDEIGDMPLPLQGKLLRVLQEGKFRRLGDREERPVDLRVIAATHRDLKKMIREGSFREDLWFRLSVVEIRIPPLRERMEDLPLLVDHFLECFAKSHASAKKKINAESLTLLSQYDWPGNIRELENTITNACVFASNAHLEPNDFRYKKELFPNVMPDAKKRAALDLKEFMKFPYREAVQFFEKKFIHQALIETGGNISRTAIQLKVARPHLSRLIKKFKIKV